MNNFYVYIYRHPETSEPFYVGKGKGNRAYEHLKCCDSDSNKHKVNTIKKILRETNSIPVIDFYKTEMSEDEAFKLEIELIKTIGRKDKKTGPLCNMTDGGDGGAGYIPPKELIDKIQEKRRTPEGRAEASLRCSGSCNGFYGEKLSDSHKQKLREGLSKWVMTDEQRKKRSDSKKGKIYTKEHKNNMSIKFDIYGPNNEVYQNTTIGDFIILNGFAFNTLYKSYKLNRAVTRGAAIGWRVVLAKECQNQPGGLR
jgi:hypothetical protein